MATIAEYIAITLFTSFSSITSFADDGNTQHCFDFDIKAFANHLHFKNLEIGYLEYNGKRSDQIDVDSRHIVNGSACKDSPTNPNERFVAITYVSKWEDPNGDGGEDGLIVGIINKKSRKILSTYYSTLYEDAAFTMSNGSSIRIDTARYNLAKGVRAFGVDIQSGYIPHCAEGWSGASRTLYVADGNKIRPILSDIVLSSSQIIEGNIGGRCGGETNNNLVQNVSVSIGIEPTFTNGFHDIKLTANTDYEKEVGTDDEPKTQSIPGKKTRSQILKYDGHKYDATLWQELSSKIWGK